MNDEKRIAQLLKNALPPVSTRTNSELRRDLWPAMLQRLETPTTAVPWWDWALLAAVIVCLLFFPGALPVLLYHL
ncbi:MAG TPA: hypothetical protein VIW67_12295 [Terriglobales bacterium]|jgi:hypothetical protein